jgi:voltage-gated potassium channel
VWRRAGSAHHTPTRLAALATSRSDRLLETLGPGDFFGEAAILTGERRNASVTAASDTNLFVLFGTEFRVLERDYPDAAEKITQKSLERTADAPQT